ncbi:MAG TPA: VOC family protein [Rhizomicrobium sp.]|nr:VOC family protein [Rhizomicrobium sp.]
MRYHQGRLFDHLHLTVRDLAASRRFYAAAPAALDIPLEDHPAKRAFSADELWVTDEGPLTGRMHFAFQAKDRAAVARFHSAGLAAGGRDNGAPGERAYGPGYYAAFLLDPDGNNVEAVHHGPRTRSAASILVED